MRRKETEMVGKRRKKRKENEGEGKRRKKTERECVIESLWTDMVGIHD